MYKRALLHGEVWFPVHSTFSATMSLAYFIFGNRDHEEVENITRDALSGYEFLISLSTHSLWADRSLQTLKVSHEFLLSEFQRLTLP